MEVAQVLSLVATYGPGVIPVVQKLVSWVEGNKVTVSSAELAELAALGQYTSTQSLANLGIQIVNGQVVPLAKQA